MSNLSKEILDKLEDLFINELLNDGKIPSAKLDILRKVLEKNNRLFVRPQGKDVRPALETIRQELEEEVESGASLLPFPVVRNR